MEVAIGIDELNWYGPTTQPFVIPMPELFDKHCKTNYCDEFESVDIAIRVGEPRGGVGRVCLSKRTSSIGVDILLDIVPRQYPEGVQEKIASQLRVAVERIAEKMEASSTPFDTQGFLSETARAIDEYQGANIKA